MGLSFDDKIPIYLQIINHIKKEMITGKLKGGDRMPSVREMAEKTRVNPNTIQRVYQELEREGVTYTQRGTGSFVTEDTAVIQKMKLEMSQEIIKTYVEGMKSLGMEAGDILSLLKGYLEGEQDGNNS
ncbi:MAG: GntR family transcriptional regulator [Clostridia bacterium]|nr:GntR family transcriptional regulator [Clostridia bacterium]